MRMREISKSTVIEKTAKVEIAEATGDKKFDSMLVRITAPAEKQAEQRRVQNVVIMIADALCNDRGKHCRYEDLTDDDLYHIASEAGSDVYTVMSILGRKNNLSELSTEKLRSYKTAAAADAKAADAQSDYSRANKRFSGIVRATLKQFDNEIKKIKAKQNK